MERCKWRDALSEYIPYDMLKYSSTDKPLMSWYFRKWHITSDDLSDSTIESNELFFKLKANM